MEEKLLYFISLPAFAAVIAGLAVWILKPEPVLPPRAVVRSVISPVELPPVQGAGRSIDISPDGSRVARLDRDVEPVAPRELGEVVGHPTRVAERMRRSRQRQLSSYRTTSN